MTQALVRARIPYLPVHIDDVERDAAQFSLIVLPNLAAISDAQAATVRHFVERGGGLLATGQASLCNEWGEPRADFALADLFGAHVSSTPQPDNETTRRRGAAEASHSYLRLAPELRARVDGPHADTEPLVTGERHPVLRGFEETDILAFGGRLEPLRVDGGAHVLMTFVPPFPVYPPETAWMRVPKTETPGLILNTAPGRGRVAFLPADLDRRFAQDNLPDHGNLLANLVRWASQGILPLAVDGPGLVDCHLYRQPGRVILHLVNLTNAGTWRQPVHELIAVGPFQVRVRLPEDVRGKSLRLLVSGRKVSVTRSKGWCHFELGSLLDHEVAVVT
jgi:hypothetical protein